MELGRDAYPTYFSRRKTEVERAAGGNSATGIALISLHLPKRN